VRIRLPRDPSGETSGGAGQDLGGAVSHSTKSRTEELTDVMKRGPIDVMREHDGVCRPLGPTGQSTRESDTARFQMLDQGCKMPLNQRFCVHLLTFGREVGQTKHPAVATRVLSDLRLIKQRKEPSHTTNQVYRALRHPSLWNPPLAVLIANSDMWLRRLVGLWPIWYPYRTLCSVRLSIVDIGLRTFIDEDVSNAEGVRAEPKGGSREPIRGGSRAKGNAQLIGYRHPLNVTGMLLGVTTLAQPVAGVIGDLHLQPPCGAPGGGGLVSWNVLPLPCNRAR